MNLIKKLSPLHAKGSWLDRKEDMGRSILKQIVDEKTRIFIDMEETKMIRAGASLTLKQIVKHAFDHEKYHKSIPTKEVNVSSNRDFGVEQFFPADDFQAVNPSPYLLVEERLGNPWFRRKRYFNCFA